jgi:hypothetical protein
MSDEEPRRKQRGIGSKRSIYRSKLQGSSFYLVQSENQPITKALTEEVGW